MTTPFAIFCIRNLLTWFIAFPLAGLAAHKLPAPASAVAITAILTAAGGILLVSGIALLLSSPHDLDP